MTSFNVRFFAGGEQFGIHLNADITERCTAEQLRQLAEDALVIQLQGRLRNSNIEQSATAIQQWLRSKGFPTAVVGEPITRQQSTTTALSRALGVSPEQLTPERIERLRKLLEMGEV